MDLTLTDEQTQLRDAFRSLYAREATVDRVRAAEPLGFDAALWAVLTETGGVPIAVGEDHDGWGGSMSDLNLIAELHGRHIAPAPLIEAQVGAWTLGEVAGASPVAAETLSAVLAGEQTVTFVPRATRGGVWRMAAGGAVADAVIGLHEHRLVLARPTAQEPVENIGSMPVSDVHATDLEVLADGEDAAVVFQSALDRWLCLTAAALVGIGARGLEMGVEYARQRSAFGTLIGTFQAVSHPLADCATALDGARLLAQRAAAAFEEEPARVRELSAMAFAAAFEAARDATYRGLHVHGGYGFGMEQDAQLYYRRARAWALVWGTADDALDRAASARYDTSVASA
ncbi:acyl-CoA dehydrogenase [uncultured Williamsia sp.]|uniref:acyl-CoA dehydrogenase n=1 Tax=uncultured Williamsia sp. TaxID=259311 RepID=UPI00263337B5|nr:acyl-CoA dehydrogenase [uncultured Williamsia sp.]